MNKRKAKRKVFIDGWGHYSKKNKEYFRTRKNKCLIV